MPGRRNSDEVSVAPHGTRLAGGAASRVRRLRLRAQGLTGDRARDVASIVRRMGGLQGQDASASALAIRSRSTAAVDLGAVRRALEEERSVVRTPAMRGTLHLVAAEDVGWLLALLGPRFAARSAGRRRSLGLDESTCERGVRLLTTVLADRGPQTRAELVAALAERDVVLDARGQAPAHLIGYAALTGALCRGPDRDGGEPTYVRLADWIAPAPPRDPEAALVELTRRYLGGHGPAGPADFAAWSGLPGGAARTAFERLGGELARSEGGWRLATRRDDEADEPGREDRGAHGDDASHVDAVRLLPAFDAWLLAYRDRGLLLAPEHAPRVQAGGGWLRPLVVADGRVLGTWRLGRSAAGAQVSVAAFAEPLSVAVRSGLAAEARDVGRFLAIPVSLAA